MKKILIILLALLFVLPVQAEGNTLTVHYHRFDENYEDWNLWLWPFEPVSGEGLAYNFTGTDSFGEVLTLDLSTTNLKDSTTIGIIVRTNNWDKDVASDRYISVDPSGATEIWLVQSDEKIYTSFEDVDITQKIMSAKFLDDNTVEFVTTLAVGAEDIQIYEDGTPFEIDVIYSGGTKRRLDVLNPLDLTKTYTIEINFGTYTKTKDINLSGLFTSDAFNDAYGYSGELGAIYLESETTFHLWAPLSNTATVNLYHTGHPSTLSDYSDQSGDDTPFATYEMSPLEQGVLTVTVPGDLNGVYYTYSVNGAEVVDPYAKAVGVNGDRGMILDFDTTDPVGWDQDIRPALDTVQNSILYELHIRDLTTSDTWNGPEELRGTFLGLAYEGTEFEGVSTGIDHIKELGVTTVHLLPVFDYAIVDETRLTDPTYQNINDGIFNWGYMPENFNAVEGSYSTNPYDGSVRVTEFKELIQAFHEAGIRVVMDVVYNHTGYSADSNFNLIFPGYYYRMDGDTFSNGSGTGNETASERLMFRKYMVDSVAFWAEEYHIDGFRFDLMKLHDVTTMNELTDRLKQIDEQIIVYGEPWTGGTSLLSGTIAASKDTLSQMPDVAIFSDVTRDAIKGSVFDETGIGFVQGATSFDAGIMLGIVGGVKHDAINFFESFTDQPSQVINYVTAHDNNTLYDKLKLSTNVSEQELINMDKQANAIVLTSQGIPFLHAGSELLRTKPCVDGECDANSLYDHNSYRSPDETNQFDWNWKVENIEVFDYYQGLISLRKAHPAFRLETTMEIQDHLFFYPEGDGGFIQYFLTDSAGGDEWNTIMVVHNGAESMNIDLLGLEWNVVVNQDFAGIEVLETVTERIAKPNETLVLYTTADLPQTIITEDGYLFEESSIEPETPAVDPNTSTEDPIEENVTDDITFDDLENASLIRTVGIFASLLGGGLIIYRVGKRRK